MRVSGLILAGGQGRRMDGKDKGWVQLRGKPMIERIIERLVPQVDAIMINANRNIDCYKQFDHIVIEDELEDYQGPLAGILSGLNQCQTELMVCVPCDTPFFPKDMIARMLKKQELSHAEIVSVSDGQRIHPVFALIKTQLASSLRNYLLSGERKIDHWYQQHHYEIIEYPDGEHYFENINTEEQLASAEQRLKNHDQ